MGVRFGAWTLVAVLGVSLVHCDVTRCPEGTAARFDQCVRSAEGRDAGRDGLADLDSGRGDARADAAEPPPDGPCDAERMWSGNQCVLKEVYVDSRNGDDSEHPDAGTQRRPFRTFHRALSDAVEHQTILFEPGVYATQAGDQFNAVVPNGVTLRKRADGAGHAAFVGNGLESLVFAGNATLVGIALRRFDSPFRVSNGELQFQDVIVSEVTGGMEIAGSAYVTCSRCAFEAGAQRGTPLIRVRGVAILTLLHTTFATTSDATCEGDVADAIHVSDHASLVLRDVHVRGRFAQAVYSASAGSMNIASSTFARGCTNNSLVWDRPWFQSSPATVDIQGSLFEADAGGTGGLARVRVRDTSFHALFWMLFTVGGVYDFGRPTRHPEPEPGRNTFKELTVSGRDVVFFASGNTWNPSQQGADAQGHYADGQTRILTGSETVQGTNFNLYALDGSLELEL